MINVLSKTLNFSINILYFKIKQNVASNCIMDPQVFKILLKEKGSPALLGKQLERFDPPGTLPGK